MAPDKRAPRKAWASVTGGPQNNGRQPQSQPQSTKSKQQQRAPELSLYKRIEDTTRVTKDYYFFHSGPLSNWHTRGTPFQGQRALEIALPLLASTGIPHPAMSTVSTQLLAQHWYNCGEQWMMACKAWLMETDVGSEDASNIPGGFQALQDDIYKASAPIGLGPRGQRLHASSLARVLRSSAPKDQKALGKTVENWNEERWEAACMPIVIAGSLARAESTPVLKEIYMDNKDGARKFVEGAPRDTIWGVGIRWDNPVINNPNHWRGTNLLGQCHDEACRMLVQAVNEEKQQEEERLT